MGFRTTAVLLVVVGLLVGLLQLTKAGPAETGEIFEPVLGGHRVASARRIVIERRATGQAMVLELGDDDRFWMVEPVRDLASSAVLRSLAGSYDTATRMIAYTAAQIEADPRLVSETGLDVPRARVRFEFPEGETVEVNLGEEAPLGQEVYLGMGDAIYRGGLDLFTVLAANVDDMRERQVFRHVPGQLRELIVERALPDGGIETLRLERQGNRFAMVEPIVARVDLNNLPVFLGDVLGLRVEIFVPGVIRPPPGVPDVKVIARGIGEETVVLWFQDGGAMLGTMEERGVSFRVTAAEARQFFEAAVQNLRSHFLVSMPTAEVMEVRLDPGGGAKVAVLRRHGEEFQLYNPVQAAIDATAVNNVMQGLRNLGVEEFVEGDASDPAFGLDRDFFTVSIVGQFDRQPVHVRLGRDEGDQTFARRDGEDQVVKIPKAVADRLRQPWIRFVAPQVQQLTAAVGELRIVQEDREIGYHRSPDGWRARGSAAADPLVGDLVDDLKDLRANAVLDPASTELPEESYRLQLRRANGDQLAELQVYDRGEGQPLLVRIERIDVLFELRASESQRIRALLK